MIEYNNSPKYLLLYTNTGKMHKNEVYCGHVRNFKRGEIEQFMCERGWVAQDVSYGGFPFYDQRICADISPFFKRLRICGYYKDYKHQTFFQEMEH